MSIWSKIRAALASVGDLMEIFGDARPPEKTVAFTIAVIALGAKMAKADGVVTRDEVAAFRQVFDVDGEAVGDVGRFFDLARQDSAGYEAYARKISRMFPPGDPVLCALLDGLFRIATADGVLHAAESAFLERVASIFGFSKEAYDHVRMRHLPPDQACPYAILGVPHGAGMDVVKAARRRMAREAHPDTLAAQGVPAEALKLAHARMARVNAAYDAIKKERASLGVAS